GRDVAIKVLPEAFAADADRLARFRREAQVLAALNHPHIAAIYGLEESGGVEALVLELVEGETLAERLARGPIPVDETLEIARQIAEALEAAHERGIVHRDLKPANVKLTPDGKVKVLDFGLAKALTGDASSPDVSTSPTLTAAATQAGIVMGTAAYMSPEQARGKGVDKRADIWAFGVILFEMLTGRRLFEGETVSDTLAAVLRQEIGWTELPAGTPTSVRRLLARCVERDLRRRLHDVADARLEIEAALVEPPQPVGGPAAGSPVPSRRAARFAPWAVALALAALALWQARAGRQDRAGLVTLSLALPADFELETQSEAQTQQIAISPDGRRLAFFARSGGQEKIFVRELSRGEAKPIADAGDGGSLFFSPDGEWIGFTEGGKLWKVAVGGGVPIELAPAGQSRGAAWAPDGTIVFAPTVNSPLLRVADRGGQPQPVTRLDAASGERTHRWPEILPNGDTVLFTVGTQDKPGDYADARIDAVSLSTGKRRKVYRGASFARYAAPGYLLLARNDSLLAARFDPGKAEILGTPTPVLQKLGGDPRSGVAFFGLARNGTLAWITGVAAAGPASIVWIDRSGKVEPSGIPPGEYTDIALSPDGRRLAYAVGAGGGAASDIWIMDLPHGSPFQLTSDGEAGSPLWTPDGRAIAYSNPNGDAVIRRSADGRGSPEILWKPAEHVPVRPDAFTPDGSKLLLSQFGLPNRGNILLLPARAGSVASPLIETQQEERDAALSPDGRWIAYSAQYSGAPEIYVQAFPEVAGRWQVSRQGGVSPRWSRDGRELFSLRGGGLVAGPVALQPTFSSGPAKALFRVESLMKRGEWSLHYDVAPEGRRFVFLVDQPSPKASPRIDVTLGWTQHLSESLR
ncbi:MAG: protein kinase domain-containing protein, partial [Acidobacteriota bacterium]